ncbi:MAG: anti-sigma factor [Actinomycetia bacterium]|nr:anti-sigma factor [Actinomycetes bacterium]
MNDDMTDEFAPGAAELAALARTLSVSDTHFDEPPAGLWAGIEALVAAGDPALRVESKPSGSVAFLRRRWPVVVGAAASLLIAVGVWSVARDTGGADQLAQIPLSNSGLAAEGVASHGDATLVRLADGHFALDVDVADLPPTEDGFLELWIIDTNVDSMYSLGPLHGSGRYPLPDHVNPAAFPVVDISIEPTDGEPTHSGRSILRGQLTL